jgi:uncharacterized membrane protein YphA (DoxX/SURF4 family)
MKFGISHTGKYIFAVALAGIAIVQFATAAMPSALMPLPETMPGKTILAYASGLVFLAAACAVIINKRAALLLSIAGIVFLLLLLYPHLPKLLSNLYNAGEWVVFLETLAFVCGCFMLANKIDTGRHPALNTTAIVCRYLFALVLMVFGIQHIMYEKFIITIIPGWMPLKLFWARVVTVAFLATALSIAINIATHLSTLLLGLMFLIWVFILHAPRVAIRSWKETEWTSMFIALAMSGICFSLATINKKHSSKI